MRAGRFRTRRSLPRGALPRHCRGPLLGGVRLRCRAWLRETHLDRELASGADPTESDELSLRSGQLTSAKNRDRFAVALEVVVEFVDTHSQPHGMRPLSRAEIRRCRTLLLRLAERVRMAGPSDVHGLAMTARLIADSASPLYKGGSSQPLASTIRMALFALELQHSPREGA